MAADAMHFLVDEGAGLVVRDAGTALTAAFPASTVTPSTGTAGLVPIVFGAKREVSESARTFATTTKASLADLSGDTEVIITRRLASSRVKPSVYAKVASQPAHGACFQDAEGNWFEFAEAVIHVYAMGAIGGNAVDDYPAFQLAADVARVRGSGYIDARCDDFIISSTVNCYSDYTIVDLTGSTINKTGTTGDHFRFGFENPGQYDLRVYVAVIGGTLVALDPGVTSGSGVMFDRCQKVFLKDVSTYGCFRGVTLAACVGAVLDNLRTEAGANWTGVKQGSAGLCLTGSPNSAHHNTAIIQKGGNLSGDSTNKYLEASTRVEEVDGYKSDATYLSFAQFCLLVAPYSNTSFLSLIELVNTSFDSPAVRHIHAPFADGYAGSYGQNSIDNGYFFNAPTMALFELNSTTESLRHRRWSISSEKCFLFQGDAIVVSNNDGYEFDCDFENVNASGNGGSCIVLINANDIDIDAKYTRQPGDGGSAYHLIDIKGTSDDIGVHSFSYRTDGANTYREAIARESTCGPNVTIEKGRTNELTLKPSAATLSIPVSVDLVQIFTADSTPIAGLDAASSYKNRRLTLQIRDGANLTSGSSFVLKGGSRSAAAGSVLDLWCVDGTNWFEV